MKNKIYDNDYELLYLVSENEDTNRIIYEKYSPVIDYYVKKYLNLVNNKGLDYNDLYQEGLIGLDEAIKKYIHHKDIKFSTFAFICIKRKIITSIRNVSRQKYSVLNESYSIDYISDDSMPFENAIILNNGGLEDILVGKEDEENFNMRINKELTLFEKQVYELRINGFSYEEIATMLNKTLKSIDSVLFRVRIKIKKILEEMN